MEGLVKERNLDEDVVMERWSDEEEETVRLAPQSCVVAVQAGTERPARYKQLGAGVVVAVGVHRVGEGMNVREVAPPRLVVILRVERAEKEEERREERL